MHKTLGIIALSLMVVACSNAQEDGSSNAAQSANTEIQDGPIVTLVDAAKFKELMNNESAQLVDVRTPAEYSQGKIGDAVNINFLGSDFKNQIATLDKSQPVLIYCASGGRSARAVAVMKDMGFQEIHELAGGYNAWR